MTTDAFATIRRARSLRQRHPDASPAVSLVALHAATYADGHNGTRIWPGHERIARETGLNRQTVQKSIRWLRQRGELRLDKAGRRGSASAYTYMGVGLPDDVKAVQEAPPNSKGVHEAPPNSAIGGALERPTNPYTSPEDSLGESTQTGESGEWHATNGDDSAVASLSGDATTHQEQDHVHADELARWQEANRPKPEPRAKPVCSECGGSLGYEIADDESVEGLKCLPCFNGWSK